MTDPVALCADTPPSVSWHRGVIGRASWTAVDHSLLGLANFAGNLVLARWLLPAEYGGYVSASALFWMIANVHNGLLIDPMMVFGSGRFHDRLSSYFAVLAVVHWCISTMTSIGLAAIAVGLILWGSLVSAWSMIGYALAAPAVLLLALLRRTVYLQSHPRLAAFASGVYTIGMLALIYALNRTATLSSFTAPLAAAGASAVATVGIMAMQRVPLWSRRRDPFMRQVATAHWRYGRWAVVSSILSWIPGS